MSKFKKSDSKSLPAISTASLPDIVFMLIIFFMVSTKIRDENPLVIVQTPAATELTKLEKKELVAAILIGKPNINLQGKFGKEERVQLNDKIATIGEIKDFISTKRADMQENAQALIVSLKVDKSTKMGVVTAVKQELRKASALKISYAAMPGKN